MCGKQGSNFLRNTTAHSFRRISAAVRMSTGGIIAPRTVGMATAEDREMRNLVFGFVVRNSHWLIP